MKRKFFFIMTLLIVFTLIITGCERKELSSLPTQKIYYENTTVTTVEPVSYGQSAQECFEQGKAFYDPFIFHNNTEASDVDKAIEAYSQAIIYEPDNAQFYYYRGCVYYMKKPIGYKLDNVLSDLAKAILLDPDYGDVYARRGLLYLYNIKDNYKAIDDYSEALRLNPKTVSAYFSPSPFATYKNLNSYKAMIYFQRGEAYQNIKEYNKAIMDFSEAIRLFPEYDPAYFSRSSLYWLSNNYEKSIADLTTILSFLPDSGDALEHRAIRYYQLGDYNKAIDDYATLLKLNPDYFIRGLEDIKKEAEARAKRQ